MESEQFLALVRSTLTDTPLPEEPDWPGITRVARRHSMLPYLEPYLDQMPQAASLENEIISVAAQHVVQMQVMEDMQAAMEAAGVDHLFFKGAVMKKRYPSPLLRTMGDIDVLYRAEQQQAFRAAMETLDYTDLQVGRKNDTYWKRPLICIEAHRQLVPATSRYADYCIGVWKRAVQQEGHAHTYEMSVEDEFVFHIIHMAMHMRKSGVGVRFVADVFVYLGLEMDREYVEKELEHLGLLRFYRQVCVLAEHWFGGKESTPTAERLGDFILAKGVFGSKELARVTDMEQGRWHYFLNTCFPPYPEMCSMYSWLTGRKVLLPLAWFVRGCGALACRRQNVKHMFRTLRWKAGGSGADMRELYRECGLDERG